MYRIHDVVRHVLPNGLTLLVRTDRSAPVVAVVTDVQAGYFDETDEITGIAHVLEHMYFKGTPTRGVGEIARQTKGVGGYLNAFTIYDHTRYYAVVPSSGFAEGLAIQADAFLNSSIDADELRRELEVIIQEAKRKADSPGAVTTETLFELLHDRHRVRRWRIGREQGLRALTRDDVVRFYRNFYRPASTVLAVVGDVDADVVLREAEAHYGALPPGEPQRSPGPREIDAPGRRFRRLTGDVQTWHAAFGWRTPDPRHPDTLRLDLAASVLGSGRASRLYRALREPGIVTSVAAWNYTPKEVGIFSLDLEGEPDRVTEALAGAWEQLAGLHGEIHPAEVERVRSMYHAQLMRRLETMEGQANWLADWESQGGWELGNDQADQVESVTAADLLGAVQRHLDPAQASLVLYQPASTQPWAADAASAFALLGTSRPVVNPPILPVEAPAVAERTRVDRVEAYHEITVFRGASALPVLVRHRPGTPVLQLSVHSLHGAAREPEHQRGIGHLLTRTSLLGTSRYTAAALARASDAFGGRLVASASTDALDWGISAPADAFLPAAHLLAEIVLRPLLGGDALERERQIARSQLRQDRDDMYRYPMRLAMSAAWKTHAYAFSATGTDDGLSAVTSEALQAWHAQLLSGGGVVVAVTGDVEPEYAAATLAALFGSIAGGPMTSLANAPWTRTAEPQVEGRDKAQTALAMGFPGPTRGDDDRAIAELLVGICGGLGGRFFEELRDKQSLGYTVALSHIARDAAGAMIAYIATDPKRESAARDGLLREIDRLRSEAVRPDELERARTYALGTRAIASQGSGFLHGEMIDAWAHGAGLTDIARTGALLRGVSIADIQRFAQRWLDPSVRVEGIVRGRAIGASSADSPGRG